MSSGGNAADIAFSHMYWTYRRFAVVSATGPLVLAMLGIVAWMTGFLRLASVRASYIPMAPSTAIGFLLMNTAIVVAARGDGPRTRHAARAAALLVCGLALVKLVEFFSGAVVLNLEARLVASPGAFGAVPLARMSPLTAVAFLATGLALASIVRGAESRRSQDVGGVLGGSTVLTGGTVALGYVYGAPLLYGGHVIPMALTTGLAFIGTGIALVLLAGPGAVPLSVFCGGSTRARLLRVFLPLAVATILVNDVLTNAMLARAHANPALLAALLALSSAAAVGLVVSWTAGRLGDAIDRAEAMLSRSRDELEDRVKERTVELSVLNQELESFSYSVSHDLRAPLRHVVGFAQLLRTDTLDESQRRYVTNIIAAAQRMGRLIDDLLGLSRNTRAVLSKRRVSLASLVRDAQTEVAVQAGARHITWHLDDPLPEIYVDRALFHLVLVNLLSNAIKYTAHKPVAEIDIGIAAGNPGEVVLFVRDNGAGFDMRYADKLFGVFQRLHGADEFEGNGVGLANVNRIVQRHGGRVWAEAVVDRGATFYIALPDNLSPSRVADTLDRGHPRSDLEAERLVVSRI